MQSVKFLFLIYILNIYAVDKSLTASLLLFGAAEKVLQARFRLWKSMLFQTVFYYWEKLSIKVLYIRLVSMHNRYT